MDQTLRSRSQVDTGQRHRWAMIVDIVVSCIAAVRRTSRATFPTQNTGCRRFEMHDAEPLSLSVGLKVGCNVCPNSQAWTGYAAGPSSWEIPAGDGLLPRKFLAESLYCFGAPLVYPGHSVAAESYKSLIVRNWMRPHQRVLCSSFRMSFRFMQTRLFCLTVLWSYFFCSSSCLERKQHESGSMGIWTIGSPSDCITPCHRDAPGVSDLAPEATKPQFAPEADVVSVSKKRTRRAAVKTKR